MDILPAQNATSAACISPSVTRLKNLLQNLTDLNDLWIHYYNQFVTPLAEFAKHKQEEAEPAGAGQPATAPAQKEK